MEFIVKIESAHLLKAAEIVANAIMGRHTDITGVTITDPAPAEIQASVATEVTPAAQVTPAAAAPVTQAAPATAPVAPVAPATPAAAPAAAPIAAAPSYTVQELMAAGAALIQSDQTGAMRTKLGALLQQYGIKAATELTAEQIPTFTQALRGLGAKL